MPVKYRYRFKRIFLLEIMKLLIVLFLLAGAYGAEETSFEGANSGSVSRITNQFPPTSTFQFLNSEDAIGYRYMQLYQNVHIFLEDGLKNNVTASQAEVSNRLESYKRVLSERFLNKNQIYNIIIIEKYLKDGLGIIPNEDAIAKLYEMLTDSVVDQAKPAFAEMEPLLNSMALFSDPQIGELIQQKNEELAREEYEKVISKKPYWSINELRAGGKPDDCIAFDPNTNRCLVTVARFNASISLMNISKKMPRDSARDEILYELLSDVYLSSLAQEKGFAEKITTKEFLAQNRTHFKNAQRFISLGRMVTDNTKLFETYKKYYRERFSPKDEVYINVLGSSDSGYIDSLYQWLRKKTRKKSPESKRDTTNSGIIHKLPWQRSDWNELLDELVAPTDSIDVNEFTRPVKTRYGYFILHLDEVNRHKGASFEEAHDELVYLATRDKWQNADSILEERAYEVYTRNKTDYVTPDTMELMLYLSPCAGDTTGKNLPPDTLFSKGLRVCSVFLPFEVQGMLKKAYYQNKSGKGLLGPIYTRYGVYYFQVRTCKRGGIQYTFDEVYEYIAAEIRADEKRERAGYIQYQDDSIDRMFLGRAYFIDDISQARTMGYDQIMEMIESGKIDISAVKNKALKSDCYQYGKAQYETMKINEYQENIDNWIKTIRIDVSVHAP